MTALRAALPPGATVAVVGAGFSGVAAAAALVRAGFRVVVFEGAADVGGVWSASRAYPGVATQDDRRGYAFSDLPMPDEAPEQVPGAEVRAYLQRYLHRHDLRPLLRLSTRVVRADPVGDAGWEVRSEDAAGSRVERFDQLVLANGVFSDPHVPEWPGRDAFEAAGGRVRSPSGLRDEELSGPGAVVVVGWGKTACDLAAVASRRGPVHVVARTLTWKYPARIGRVLGYRHLILTRAGERLLGGGYRGPTGRLLLRRLPERLPRVLLGRLLARAVDRRLGLTALGLRPALDVRASNSLVTRGFFEGVADGRITVHRERGVRTLGADADGPWVELTDGSRIAAGTLIAATGYRRTVDLLAPSVRARLLDRDGVMLLHRRVVAVDVPRLAFLGWTHQYRTPVSVEVAAAWLAGVLAGRVRLPSEAHVRRGAARLPVPRGSARSGPSDTLPGLKMRELDVLLGELGAPLPLRVRLRQVWRPLDPADYAEPLQRAAARGGARRAPAAPVPAGQGADR